jgi:hypothetical protein
MNAPEDGSQLPPPLPGSEAADKRSRNPIPPTESVKPAEGRPVSRAVFIGVGAFLLYAAIPIVITVVLAFLAQSAINGH